MRREIRGKSEKSELVLMAVRVFAERYEGGDNSKLCLANVTPQ